MLRHCFTSIFSNADATGRPDFDFIGTTWHFLLSTSSLKVPTLFVSRTIYSILGLEKEKPACEFIQMLDFKAKNTIVLTKIFEKNPLATRILKF